MFTLIYTSRTMLKEVRDAYLEATGARLEDMLARFNQFSGPVTELSFPAQIFSIVVGVGPFWVISWALVKMYSDNICALDSDGKLIVFLLSMIAILTIGALWYLTKESIARFKYRKNGNAGAISDSPLRILHTDVLCRCHAAGTSLQGVRQRRCALQKPAFVRKQANVTCR